jgi:mannitol/fructose-specific phosphotransferase system IIA component
MSKNGAEVEDAWSLRHKHRAAVQRNHERSEMLKAIIKTWEDRGTFDEEYLRGLRARQRQAENQLRCMKP